MESLPVGFISVFENAEDIPHAPPKPEDQLEIFGATMMITYAFDTLTASRGPKIAEHVGDFDPVLLRRKFADIMPWPRIYRIMLERELQFTDKPDQSTDELVEIFKDDPTKGIQAIRPLLTGGSQASLDSWFSVAQNFIGLPDEWDRKLFLEGFLGKIPYTRLELDPIRIRDSAPSSSGFLFEGPARIFVTLYRTGSLSLSFMLTMAQSGETRLRSPYLFSQNESLIAYLQSALHADDLIHMALLPEREISIQTTMLQQGTLTQLAKGTSLKILQKAYAWSESLSLDDIAAKLRLSELPGRANTSFDLWSFKSNFDGDNAAKILGKHIWELRGIVDLNQGWRSSRPALRDLICFSPLPEVAISLSDFAVLELDLRPNWNSISFLGFDRPTSRVQELFLQQQSTLDSLEVQLSPIISFLKDVQEDGLAKELRAVLDLKKDLLYSIEALWNMEKQFKELYTENFFRFGQTRRRIAENLENLRRKIDEVTNTLNDVMRLSENEKGVRYDVAEKIIGLCFEIGYDQTKFGEERELIISSFRHTANPHARLVKAFGQLLQKIAESYQISLHGVKEYSGIDISKKMEDMTIGFQIKSVGDDISEEKLRAQTTKAMEYDLDGFVWVLGMPTSGRVETSKQAAYHFFKRIKQSRKMYCSLIDPELLAELFRKHRIYLH